MSRYSGKYGKGASRAVKRLKHYEAKRRNKAFRRQSAELS